MTGTSPHPWHESIDLTAWQNAEHDPAVMVANGAHVKLTTHNGQLQVIDGPPGMPRQRTIPRIPRTIQRLIILAGHGYVTIEAQRWLAQAGISWTIHDNTDQVIAASGPGNVDARLLRAQSRAIDQPVGLTIARYLLQAKLDGQAQVTRDYFPQLDAATFIDGRCSSLARSDSIQQCTVHEGLAAESYWRAWEGRVPVPFNTGDAARVPRHWLGFTQRHSLAYEVIKNRGATDPVNAVLNYLYRVAETECVHACHAAGLSPVLGIVHVDKPGRDSLALDLLETVRPYCDRIALDLFLTGERFNRQWLIEMRDGIVRLDAPLTHRLCSHAAAIGRELIPHVSEVASLLARSATGIVTVKRPAYKARGPKSSEYRGYPAARLNPGVTVTDLVPDQAWAQIQPLMPERGRIGRPSALSDREAVATLAARYIVRAPWAQALTLAPAVHRSTITARLRLWQSSGIWEQVRKILGASGHLPGVSVP